MSMEDVWFEPVHESERRDGKKANSAPVGKDDLSAEGEKARPTASKVCPAKEARSQKETGKIFGPEMSPV